MKLKALLPLVPLTLASALGAGIWTPNQALYLRTDGLNVGGDDFTGATPSNDISVLAAGGAGALTLLQLGKFQGPFVGCTWRVQNNHLLQNVHVHYL